MKHHQITTKHYFIKLVLALFIGCSIVISHNVTASAVSSSGWQAGNIISDSLFYSNNSMSVTDIQNFMNSLVPNCDTNGTQPATEYGSSLTHAQYAASQGWPGPPYTCLKNYYQVPRSDQDINNLQGQPIPSGAISAAQIIKNAADTYSISPKVLLTTLQKESLGPLLTDTWPLDSQYRNPMGYGCPDTAPCDPTYEGFYNQVTNAAWQFNQYKVNAANFRYKPFQNNTISYNPSTSCGASSVYLQDYATAGLYNYTPYQPNQAALNNLYGTGDSCSAYGNRNFWRIYNDWFGISNSSSTYVAVIQDPSSSALYLQTSAGKYYIPSTTILQAWGLDKYQVQTVTQTYFDSLTTGPNVGRLLEDSYGNLFIIDNATAHYIRSASYANLWGLDPTQAVQSQGIVNSLPGSTWVGRFVQDSSLPNGQIWLIDNGSKRAVPNSNALYEWGYTPDQLTTVSTTYLNSLPTLPNVSQYASDGATDYLIDTNAKFSFPDPNVENAYFSGQTPTTYSPITLSFLSLKQASQFVQDPSSGGWFMLENARRHYILKGYLANDWGLNSSQRPIVLSSGFIQSLVDGGNLSYIVQTTAPSMYWVLDGTKRYINGGAVASAWIPAGYTPPVYSSQSLNLLPRGSDITTSINGSGSPYTYLMDAGVKRYLSTNNALDGWGANNNLSTIGLSLLSSIPEGSFINTVVNNGSNQAYLLMNSTAYPIDPTFNDAWGVSTSTPTVSSTTISRYATGQTLQGLVKIGGVNYFMANGQTLAISQYSDAYIPEEATSTVLPSNYFSSQPEVNYIVKSTDASDKRTWFIANGSKILLSSFEQQVSYGYLSRNIQPSMLSPSVLNSIPDSTQQFSLLIQKAGSGIKFVSFGYSLGFPDGNTLTNYISASNPVIQVSASVFDSFVLRRSTTQLIVDDYGNYYWVESGFKRPITSGAALSRYTTTPVTYLEGTTINLIPTGSPII